MARKTTRRSISLKGTTYARLRSHCEETGRSISGLLEEIIAEHLTEIGVPEWTGPVPTGRTQPTREDKETASGIFTF